MTKVVPIQSIYCSNEDVSVLPWQISDITEVKSPLQFFVMAYYFDNINEITKTFYNPDSANLSVSQAMSIRQIISRI